MKSPITGKKMSLQKDKIPLTYRKETFEIVHHTYVCKDSKEQFTTAELDHINQIQVHNQYRTKYGIPFPKEIKNIRTKYGISASKMSEILGFGANSYRLYESGDMPSVSNGRLIRTVNEPEEFIKQVQASAPVLGEKETTKLLGFGEKAKKKYKKDLWDQLFLEQNLFFEAPNAFTGYVIPDFDKIAQVIAFLDKQLKNLYKTKLNKLLFYCDFEAYRKTGFSITGLSYRAIPFGPVPADYDKVFLRLNDDGKIEINEIAFDNGHYGEVIRAKDSLQETTLSDDQIAILKTVVKKFKKASSKDLVEISHKELAWIENHEERRTISYQEYAFSLNIEY